MFLAYRHDFERDYKEIRAHSGLLRKNLFVPEGNVELHSQAECEIILGRVIDEETLAQMNRRNAMPPDADPAWREAAEYGFNMSLLKDALRLTPEQRLEQHQHALDAILELKEAGAHHAAKCISHSEPGCAPHLKIRGWMEKRSGSSEIASSTQGAKGATTSLFWPIS